jgi:GTPase SAR1 family protein
VGDEGVGKSALVRRFTSGMFVEVNIKSSIIQTYSKHVFSQEFSVLPNTKNQKFILWEAVELSLKYVSSVTLVHSK